MTDEEMKNFGVWEAFLPKRHWGVGDLLSRTSIEPVFCCIMKMANWLS